jgi:hypothetical protein
MQSTCCSLNATADTAAAGTQRQRFVSICEDGAGLLPRSPDPVLHRFSGLT